MKLWDEQLYRLLPAVYQIRDGEHGEPLKKLLTLVGEQAQLVQEDIEQLYDNWFIETCQDWVVPYLGDLVGFRSPPDAGQPVDGSNLRTRLLNRFLFPRRQIANLVARRRRKGTLSVLEDVARDVTGWPARAVEFARLVAFFQNVLHPEPALGRTLCVHDREALARVDTPFDRLAHTPDMREIQSIPGVGWYHPYKVGLFVWRRKIYSATGVRPCRLKTVIRRRLFTAVLYALNRVGTPSPLYVNPVAESDELGQADERHVPVPLYRHLLRDEAGHASNDFYGLRSGQPKSLAIEVRWTSECVWEPIPNCHVHVCALSNRKRRKRLACSLPCNHIIVDPECGLLMTKSRIAPYEIRVSYHYSFSADLGGGEYERPVIDEGLPTIRLRQDECRLTRCIPNLFQEAELYLTNAMTGTSGCGFGSLAPLDRVESPVPGSDTAKPSPAAADHAAPTAVPTNKGTSQGNNDAASQTEWHVRSSLCIELQQSDTWEVLCAEPLHIHDHVTFEIRAANGAWPLVKLRAASGESCEQPWRVRMGKGSRLIVDGLLLCGGTIALNDCDHCGSSESELSPAEMRQPVDCTCESNRRSAGCEVLEVTNPTEVVIHHSTFVPGGRAAKGCHCQPNHASIMTELADAHVCIRHSVVGTLSIKARQCEPDGKLPAERNCPMDPLKIHIADSVVDAAYGLPAIHAPHCRPAHADLTVERTTMLGDVCVQQITRAEDSVFAGVVHAQRRNHGYMRFCYAALALNQIPALDQAEWVCRFISAIVWQNADAVVRTLRSESRDQSSGEWCYLPRMPRRFKCLPESSDDTRTQPTCVTGCGTGQSGLISGAITSERAAQRGYPRPIFVSTDYGHPGYCQLSLDCPREIVRGAEDQSELGVFHDLFNPQRNAALAARLQEYSPAEMQSAVIDADDLHPASFQQRTSPCHQD